jgi:hypothetical protein
MSYGAVVRSYDEVAEYHSSWEVGATGAHTKTTGVPGKGFLSVARTAAGKYTVTFTEVPQGPLVELRVIHWSQTGAAPLLTAPVDGTYNPTTKTVQYNAWLSSTLAATEIPSGDRVSIVAVFEKTR